MTNISTERLEEMRRSVSNHGGAILSTVYTKDYLAVIDELLAHRSLDKGEAEPVAWSYELATKVLGGVTGEEGYACFERRITEAKPDVPSGSVRNLQPLFASPQPNKGEVVELVKKLRLWSETPYEGDPMVDALLGDAADAMSAILSLQRELREARMQALASDGQAQEAWEERGRVENERNQMARDWSEFCEAIGMAVDAHEVVAEAVGAKFAEYALVSQPAPKGGEITEQAKRYMLAVKRLGEDSGYNRLTFFESPISKMPTEELASEAQSRWVELSESGKALTAAIEAMKEA